MFLCDTFDTMKRNIMFLINAHHQITHCGNVLTQTLKYLLNAINLYFLWYNIKSTFLWNSFDTTNCNIMYLINVYHQTTHCDSWLTQMSQIHYIFIFIWIFFGTTLNQRFFVTVLTQLIVISCIQSLYTTK